MKSIKSLISRILNHNEAPLPIEVRDFWEKDEELVFEKLWQRIQQLPPSFEVAPKTVFNWWKLATAAASVALLMVVGWHLLIHERQPVETAYVIESGSQVTLSDGTKVWLSAHSQLRYQRTFTGKTRDVALEGEAYFEVAHNSKQPFRVLAGGQTVVALGTSFNVRAYTGEPVVKVALVEGSVRVTNDNTGQAVVLKPAEEATIVKDKGILQITDNMAQQTNDVAPAQETAINKDAASIAVKGVDLDKMMSWKTGKYVFYNMTFEEIAKMLEKGFKVTIQIENEDLKSNPFSARFENGESLETILNLIQINAKYSYHYHNGNIVIK